MINREKVARTRYTESKRQDLYVTSRNVNVVKEVDQVKWKPRNSEYRDHGDQHPVSPALPLAISLLLARVLGAGLAASPVIELERHSHVAEGDDEERKHELHRRRHTAKHLPDIHKRRLQSREKSRG